MRIVLVGMPASGKSTTGKLLAQKTGFDFIDLDTLLVARQGCSIPEIFADQGETGFRLAEQEALRFALQQEKLILATGGGTPCFFDNMAQINASSLSIYLKTPLPVIVQRIQADQENIRPLYDHQSPEELLQSLKILFQKRSVFYEQAQLCF